MFGQSIQFGSLWGLPTVTTSAATNLDTTTLTANGNVTDLGPAQNQVTRGFYIGTNASYSSNTKYTLSGTQSIGTFSYNATGLTGSTTYYITAFAIGPKGESVGTTVSVSTLSASFVPYTAGQTTGWTYDQCFCGTANGSGTMGGSYKEIYAPYWGGGGFTTNSSYDLSQYSTAVVTYTYTSGIPAYMGFYLTAQGHSSKALITGGSSPQLAYASGASISVTDWNTTTTIGFSLSNASSSRVRITKLEFFP